MCGINGFNWKNKSLINSMSNAIKHRGPDDTGLYTDEMLSLGHVRLSIFDLSSAGHQPMFYSKNKGASSQKYNKKEVQNSPVSIVYNGEVYNYKEIKKQLEKKGYKFTTQTDTEVVLASYLEYGTNCVEHFNGMWAFCVYDKRNKILFCSRDRLGQKPLYYYNKNGKFIFSSELKGILEHKNLKINKTANINKDALDLYFSMGCIPSPYSIYNDVFKLEARQNLIFDLRKKEITKKWNYYDMPKYKPVYNKKKLVKEGRELLKDAVKLRMRSDVPVGAFLSGGLDSSTVVGVMKDFTDLSKLHTFSIGFGGKYDETQYIKIAKDHFKTKHHHSSFTKKDFENLVDDYSYVYDEPFGDYSGFPTYKLSDMAKKYVTVSLSGEGGDEIFGGYAEHVTGYRMDMIYKISKSLRKIFSKMPAKKNLNGFASVYLLKEAFKVSLSDPKFFYANALLGERIMPEIYREWSTKKLEYCLEKGGNRLSEALRIYDLLFNTLQDLFLVKIDKASMAKSLEVRSPFLDYRLVEFSQKIPVRLKQDFFKTKKLMREIIKDILPEKILFRGKQGFIPPVSEWILEKEYEQDLIKFNGFLKEVNPKLNEFFRGKVFKEKNKLYTNYKIRLFLFGKWYQMWIK